MAPNDQLIPMTGASRWRGFGPLLGKENRIWWGTWRWLVQALLWLVVVNGLLSIVLFIMPRIVPAESITNSDPLQSGLQAFFGVGGIALAIGVIVLAQDAVIGERQLGTAEWILSKPVSRISFWLSKLVAHAIGTLLILIKLQGVVAFLQLSAVAKPSTTGYLGALGILTLHTLFYLTLTLMMGVIVDNRGLVLGASLGTLLAGTLLVNFKPLIYVTPWALPNLASAVAMSAPLAANFLIPIVVTAAWCFLFVAIALWRMERLEF